MPAVANYLRNQNRTSASATGLSALNQTGPQFSWCAWVRSELPHLGLGASLWAHADNQASPRNGIGVHYSPGGVLRYRPWTSAQQLVDSPRGVVTFDWHHVGLVATGARVFFLRDGRVVDSIANTVTPTATGTRVTQIGWTVAGTQSLTGARLWDVRAFPNVALTLAEMAALADPREDVGRCLQRLFYQRNWRAAGAGAVTIYDESGHGHNLTASTVTAECDVAPPPNWRQVLYGRKVFGWVPPSGAVTASGGAVLELAVQGAAVNPVTASGGAVLELRVQGAAVNPVTASGGAVLELRVQGTAVNPVTASGGAVLELLGGGSATSGTDVTAAGAGQLELRVQGTAVNPVTGAGGAVLALRVQGSAVNPVTAAGGAALQLAVSGAAVNPVTAAGGAVLSLRVQGSAVNPVTASGGAVLSLRVQGAAVVVDYGAALAVDARPMRAGIWARAEGGGAVRAACDSGGLYVARPRRVSLTSAG